MPGVNSDTTLLYAPEIKFGATRIITDKGLESTVPKIYVAGDGAGVSRGIVGAACTGKMVADDIIEKDQ